jgi:hypothetical protein
MHLNLLPAILLLAAAPLAAAADRPASAPPVPAVASSSPAPVPAATVTGVIDGKVAGLNSRTFTALQTIKRRNPGALSEVDMRELATVIKADGNIDPAESDLLKEMTQSQFRSITVTLEGAAPTAPKVVTYPVSGNAKRVLQDLLNPPLDLASAWAGGQQGWNAIIAEYKKSPLQEAKVINFVAGRLGEQWKVSNQGNGYKPLRDVIGQRYGFSNSAGSDTNTGRTILYKAMNQLDQGEKDRVPDFLYNWVRPGGYL